MITPLMFFAWFAVASAQPCYIEGTPTPAVCHQVPVSGTTTHGEVQRLRVVVLPALGAPRAPDPLFLFSGGPGQAASELGGMLEQSFSAVRARRDLVLIDQRGTGVDGGLECAPSADFTMDGMVQTLQTLLNCRPRWRTDVTLLNTAQAAKDTEAVRVALGFETINLWGGSYGTRLAQEYMRRYPSRVRSAVLDGVVAPNITITEPAEAYAWETFQRIDQDCQADADCAQRFGSTTSRLLRLMGRSSEASETLSWLNPINARLETRSVPALQWSALTRVAMYTRNAAQALPYALFKLENGEPGPMQAVGASIAWRSTSSMTLGQTLSVMCADDFARVAGDRLTKADPAQPFHATYALEWWRACEKWSVPASALSNEISHVPSLLLSGVYDPVTPPQSAERARSLLSKSQHLVAKQAAHGVTHLGCAPKLIAQFIDQAGAEVLDGRCLDLIASPPFLLDGSRFDITNAANAEPKS